MPEVFTPHLSLPLPDPGNSLAEDVLRIRDAFTVIDQKIAALDTVLASDDLTLDTLQELVAAIKAARTEVGSVNTLVANQLAIQNVEVTARLETISALVYAGL